MGFFRRFLLSYIFILIVPLVLELALYELAASAIERDVIDSRTVLLERLRDMVDKNLEAIDELSLQLTSDPAFTQMLSAPAAHKGSESIFAIWDFQRTLRARTMSTNLFNGSLFIFLTDANLVFTRDEAFLGLERFYGDAFSFKGMDYEAWRKEFFTVSSIRAVFPAREAMEKGNSKSLITYMNSIPRVEGARPLGAVVFCMDADEVCRLLEKVTYKGSGRVSVRDSNGDLIVETGEGNGDGKDAAGSLIIATVGRALWRYEARIPRSAVDARIAPVRNAAIIIALLALIIGMTVALIVSFKNAAPFRAAAESLLNFLGPKNISANKIDGETLREGIDRMIADARAMEKELERETSAFRIVAAERLLEGNSSGANRARELLSTLDVAEGRGLFVVLVFRTGEEALIPSTLHETVVAESEKLPHPHFLYRVGQRETALCLQLRAESADDAMARAEMAAQGIAESLRAVYGPIVKAGIGSARAAANELGRSYREARAATRATETMPGNCVVRYDAIGAESRVNYYPMDIEARLTNLIATGDRKEVEAVIGTLREANFSQPLPETQTRLLAADLRATLGKIIANEGGQDAARVIGDWEEGPIEGRADFEFIAKKAIDLCDYFKEKRNAKYDRLVSRILDWLEENYADPNLGVAAAAGAFGLSESYFAQLFKAATGTPFATRLEGVRIQKAKTIIATEREKIDSVAKRIGYATPGSFRRAFKRVTGVSPSDYAASCSQETRQP